jgi:hypothetical protein
VIESDDGVRSCTATVHGTRIDEIQKGAYRRILFTVNAFGGRKAGGPRCPNRQIVQSCHMRLVPKYYGRWYDCGKEVCGMLCLCHECGCAHRWSQRKRRQSPDPAPAVRLRRRPLFLTGIPMWGTIPVHDNRSMHVYVIASCHG